MNCIIVDDEPFSRKILREFIDQTEILNLVAECSGPVEAINTLQQKEVDLMFLDIKMPGMTGMELINSLQTKPMIILITAHEEYAIEAFEKNVTDYIVKPINYARFSKGVQKAIDLYKTKFSSENTDEFFVRSDGALVKINASEVLWIEALENYMTINTGGGKHVIHITMKALEDKLASEEFIRVHRSFIVRKDKIESIIDDRIVIGKKHIPVGRTYKKELNNKLNLL